MYSSPDPYDDGEYRKRESARKDNILLMRNLLGKTRPSTYKLPGNEFVYGSAPKVDDEGAREVIGIWKSHTPSQPPASATHSLSSSTSRFSKTQTTRRTSSASKSPSKTLLARNHLVGQSVKPDYVPDITFGHPCRPSTPINNVLNNSYQRKWVQEQVVKKELETKQLQEKKQKIACKDTIASLGHKKVLVSEEKPLFKMSKFQNVNARVTQFMNKTSTKSITTQINEQPTKSTSTSKVATSASRLEDEPPKTALHPSVEESAEVLRIHE